MSYDQRVSQKAELLPLMNSMGSRSSFSSLSYPTLLTDNISEGGPSTCRIASLNELDKFIGLNEFIEVTNLPGLHTNRLTTKELATNRIVALNKCIEFIEFIDFIELHSKLGRIVRPEACKPDTGDLRLRV